MPICSRNFPLCISDSSNQSATPNIKEQPSGPGGGRNVERPVGSSVGGISEPVPGTELRSEQKPPGRTVTRMGTQVLEESGI